MNKNAFPVYNIAIGDNNAVPLGHPGPLRVMLCCLFNLDSISGSMRSNFHFLLLDIEPQQCKF